METNVKSQPIDLVAFRQKKQRQVVYFVHAKRLDLIKIGSAGDPAVRLRRISLECPDQMEILGTRICWNKGALELALHKRFADSRLRGEWFTPTPELLEFIAQETDRHLPLIAKLHEALSAPMKPRGRKPKLAA